MLQITRYDENDYSLALATNPVPQEDPSAIKWWLPLHDEKLAARDKSFELVMLGDSITHGWAGEGKEVWRRYFADIPTLNLGFSGDRTENVLWRLIHGEVDGLNPKLVVIMIGTNNTGHRMDSPEVIAVAVQKILAELDKRLPKAKVLVLAIFPRGESEIDPMRINNRQANRLLKSIATDAGVEFADFNAAFLSETGDLILDNMPDLLHPSALGYEVWAEQLQPYFNRYLERE